MGNFFKGFMRGVGKVLEYRIIGPVQVVDLLMVFNFGVGFIRGWDDPDLNALVGWGLCAWFYMCLRLVESSKGLDQQAIEDATEALKLAGEALEAQQTHIKEQQAEIEALKNQGKE